MQKLGTQCTELETEIVIISPQNNSHLPLAASLGGDLYHQ